MLDMLRSAHITFSVDCCCHACYATPAMPLRFTLPLRYAAYDATPAPRLSLPRLMSLLLLLLLMPHCLLYRHYAADATGAMLSARYARATRHCCCFVAYASHDVMLLLIDTLPHMPLHVLYAPPPCCCLPPLLIRYAAFICLLGCFCYAAIDRFTIFASATIDAFCR